MRMPHPVPHLIIAVAGIASAATATASEGNSLYQAQPSLADTIESALAAVFQDHKIDTYETCTTQFNKVCGHCKDSKKCWLDCASQHEYDLEENYYCEDTLLYPGQCEMEWGNCGQCEDVFDRCRKQVGGLTQDTLQKYADCLIEVNCCGCGSLEEHFNCFYCKGQAP